ncbi:hypothetical protein [Streptomyces sp. TLI_146]|uniref:hypothetical protein n=1 Tax=Streptomyces sp. TLI_146 TaxID=1938858 RepID=UPI000CA8C752|nr:hypothetical protein [Streptomyces sp. TLI_146]PKV84248.1 hypothetical protein BX283_1760 [Streptomyces sp. TLI_146]
MARIRTIKPEAFESEDLASVSVTAERTFFGLLTQADDSGRHRDHPAIIAGRLWALRPEHTATHVAQDLEELAGAGLICRYTGCDGRTWLHVVTWERHQKIDRPSASRLPRCPHHQVGHKCGGCGAAQCSDGAGRTTVQVASPTPRAVLAEDSSRARGALAQPDTAQVADEPHRSGSLPAPPAPACADPHDMVAPHGRKFGVSAGQESVVEGSPSPRRSLDEPSASGSRILDPGSFPTGRGAPAADASLVKVSAKQLVAEYVRGCNRRPPEDFLGHLGRKVNALLEERFEAGDIRAALDKLRSKSLHPSVLPSLVNEVVNAAPQSAASQSSASGAGPWATTGSSYSPYLNPTAEPTTFGGSL